MYTYKIIDTKFLNLSDYEEVYISDFPTSYLYDRYDRISIRTLNIKEIQNYSSYDTDNPFNFSYKIDEILENCVLYYKADIDSYIHYSHIYDADKLWLLYTIREKTFPNGFVLEADIDNENIKLIRRNITSWRLENSIQKLYKENCFILADRFKILPPTIGLKRCFENYRYYTDNESFINYGVYLCPNISFMNRSEIEKEEMRFESLNIEDFFILKDFIDNHFKTGIKGINDHILDKKSILQINLKTFSLFQMPLDYLLRNRILLVQRGFSDRDIDNWEYWRFQSNIDLITKMSEPKSESFDVDTVL